MGGHRRRIAYDAPTVLLHTHTSLIAATAISTAAAAVLAETSFAFTDGSLSSRFRRTETNEGYFRNNGTGTYIRICKDLDFVTCTEGSYFQTRQ